MKPTTNVVLPTNRRRLLPKSRWAKAMLVAVPLGAIAALVVPRVLFEYSYPSLELIMLRTKAGVVQAGPQTQVSGCWHLVSRAAGEKIIVTGIQSRRFGNMGCALELLRVSRVIPIDHTPFRLAVEYRWRKGVYEIRLNDDSATVRFVDGTDVAPPVREVWSWNAN